jgi:glycosyltransferase involved in cell wall biosynthesis
MQVATKGLRWEIIVVDNNSTDNTFNIVKEFKKNSKVPVKYVKEEKQGLSHARNRGIRESKGRHIAFIDDDALADCNWIIYSCNFWPFSC